jgi:prepilin-type N-terminal cleavage/methylation domain-containing protein
MARFRSGFTLIELLVCVAVIAILVSLILPAVQQAREAARKIQCRNNLKQLGIALHNYHDTNGAFPPGWISRDLGSLGNRPKDGGFLWAWGTFLLPYCEQTALYEGLGVERSSDPPGPGNPGDKSVQVFVCPSDSGGAESGIGLWRRNMGERPVLVKGYAKSNYVAVNGFGLESFDVTVHSSKLVFERIEGFAIPRA